MNFDTAFNTIPIIAGVIFGCIFLIILLCILCRLCGGMNRSDRRFQPTVVGPSTVTDINSQFNQPLPATGPYHTFPSTPNPPSAPAENYPLDPRYQYPSAQSHPIHHHQNTPYPPMPQNDAPPSYNEVIASSR